MSDATLLSSNSMSLDFALKVADSHAGVPDIVEFRALAVLASAVRAAQIHTADHRSAVETKTIDIEAELKELRELGRAGSESQERSIGEIIGRIEYAMRSPPETLAPPAQRHSRDCDCHDCHYSKKHPQVKPHHARCGCFECAPRGPVETSGSPLTLDEQGTWNADGSKDWWQPTWERRTAVSYGEKAETFVPLPLLTEALGLLQRARYFTPESDPPALTHEINNFLGTFGIAAKGYSPVPTVDGLPIYAHVGNVIGPDEEGDVLVDWDSEAHGPKVGKLVFVRLWTQAEIDAAHKAGEELFRGLNVDGGAVKANEGQS